VKKKLDTRSFTLGARRRSIATKYPCRVCAVSVGANCCRIGSGGRRWGHTILGIHAERLKDAGLSLPERGSNPHGSSPRRTRAEIEKECERAEKKLAKRR
jgi:hypothetical protein